MARTPYPSKERNMTDIPSVNDTARSLLAFFGTMAEWGERGTIGQHGASPELMALVCAVLDIVPAAWQPYPSSLERSDGYVNLYQPTSDPVRTSIGSFNRCMAVHDVPRPPRYVERDSAQPVPVAVDQAVVAALVGLASVGRYQTSGSAISEMQGIIDGRFGCARVVATLTDEDIAKAEQDDLGGEGG